MNGRSTQLIWAPTRPKTTTQQINTFLTLRPNTLPGTRSSAPVVPVAAGAEAASLESRCIVCNRKPSPSNPDRVKTTTLSSTMNGYLGVVTEKNATIGPKDASTAPVTASASTRTRRTAG